MTRTREQLIRLARLGALKRLEDLAEERKTIEALLQGGAFTRAVRRSREAAPVAKPRRRPSWSAAQRKAAADRMKAYWEKRKGSRKK